MKVLYVTNMYPSTSYIYNGIHVKEQIEYLVRNYQIEQTLYFIKGKSNKLNYIKSIIYLNHLIRKKNFDLIHIHFGLSGLFLLFNPFIKVPTLVTLHGSDIGSSKLGGLIKYVTKLVVNRADKVIILNEKMFGFFKKQTNKLVKIPCGITLNEFSLKRNNNSDFFLIGFPASRKREEKNYTLFEEIINVLIAQGFKIKTIEFHNLTRSQVAENLSKLDCLLMTSHREGSPQIIKEAMVCKVPVISSNVGDVEMLLKGVNNSYVINSFCTEEFVQKIVELIRLKPENRITNGMERIKLLGLDQHSVCSKIFELYKSMTYKSS